MPRPAVSSPAEILAAIQARREVRVEDSLRDYAVRISRATRQNPDIQLGASPRATLALYQAAQALAALQGREYVLPDDIKRAAGPVLSHRLVIAPQAQLRGRSARELVDDIVSAVAVPVET